MLLCYNINCIYILLKKVNFVEGFKIKWKNEKMKKNIAKFYFINFCSPLETFSSGNHGVPLCKLLTKILFAQSRSKVIF